MQNINDNAKNFFILRNTKKTSFRENRFFKLFLFLSCVLYTYVPILQDLNSNYVSLNALIGFENNYVNFIVLWLLSAFILYLFMLLLIKIITNIILTYDLKSLFGKKRVESYFIFWFMTRNIMVGIYLLVSILLCPALLTVNLFFNMCATLVCVYFAFRDIRKYVIGTFFAPEIFSKLKTIFFVYYLLYFVLILVEVM